MIYIVTENGKVDAPVFVQLLADYGASQFRKGKQLC